MSSSVASGTSDLQPFGDVTVRRLLLDLILAGLALAQLAGGGSAEIWRSSLASRHGLRSCVQCTDSPAPAVRFCLFETISLSSIVGPDPTPLPREARGVHMRFS